MCLVGSVTERFWWLMGLGIDWMIAVSQWVASLTNADRRKPRPKPGLSRGSVFTGRQVPTSRLNTGSGIRKDRSIGIADLLAHGLWRPADVMTFAGCRDLDARSGDQRSADKSKNSPAHGCLLMVHTFCTRGGMRKVLRVWVSRM